MRRTKRKNDYRRGRRLAVLLLLTAAGSVLLTQLLPLRAELSTSEQLSATGQKIQELQERSREAKEALDAANQEKSAIGKRLDELNDQLEQVKQDLEVIQADIDSTNDDIDASTQAWNELEESRQQRYEAMKVRIRFMYERGDLSFVETLLGAGSMSELLNQAEYIAQVVAYDRAELASYRELLAKQQETTDTLNAQKDRLLGLLQEQNDKMTELSGLVADARSDLEAAAVDAQDLEDLLASVDTQLDQQLAYEQALEEQKAAEDQARLEEIRRQEEALKQQKALQKQQEALASSNTNTASDTTNTNTNNTNNGSNGNSSGSVGSSESSTGGSADSSESGSSSGSQSSNSSSESGSSDNGSTGTGTAGNSSAGTATDLELLAAIIQCEADSEPYVGKLAVGSVVMNRVASSSYPNSVMLVIYQSGQFSPVASGRFASRLAAGANSTCRQAAQEVLNGNITVPYLYFRTNNGTIDGEVIGSHVFY